MPHVTNEENSANDKTCRIVNISLILIFNELFFKYPSLIVEDDAIGIDPHDLGPADEISLAHDLVIDNGKDALVRIQNTLDIKFLLERLHGDTGLIDRLSHSLS